MAALVSVPRPLLLHHFRQLTSPFLHLLRALKTATLPTPLRPNPEPLLHHFRHLTSPVFHLLRSAKTPKLPTPLLPNPEPLLRLFSRDTSPSLLHVKASASASAPTLSPLLTESARTVDGARARKSQETKPAMFSLAVNSSWKKKIIGLVLLCFIASIASAEARAYPGSEKGGSQGQVASATTSFGLDDPIFPGLAAECNVTAIFEKMKGEYDSKLLYMCGPPCCGKNYHGPCCKCCSKGNGHIPEPAMNDVEKAGNGGGGGHGGDNGHN